VSSAVGVGGRLSGGSEMPESEPACASRIAPPKRRLDLNCAGFV
jgi:hypothetical protein